MRKRSLNRSFTRRIASLKDFAQCPNLQELYLRKNEARSSFGYVDLTKCSPASTCASALLDSQTVQLLGSAQVADLDEVRHLSGLKNLRVLWLCDNPCASRDDYRAW